MKDKTKETKTQTSNGVHVTQLRKKTNETYSNKSRVYNANVYASIVRGNVFSDWVVQLPGPHRLIEQCIAAYLGHRIGDHVLGPDETNVRNFLLSVTLPQNREIHKKAFFSHRLVPYDGLEQRVRIGEQEEFQFSLGGFECVLNCKCQVEECNSCICVARQYTGHNAWACFAEPRKPLNIAALVPEGDDTANL
jgi:hypothetical protein